MNLANTHPTFQESIAKIAASANETQEAVYDKWKEYCQYCKNFDQSPVLFEFCQWHGYSEPRYS